MDSPVLGASDRSGCLDALRVGLSPEGQCWGGLCASAPTAQLPRPCTLVAPPMTRRPVAVISSAHVSYRPFPFTRVLHGCPELQNCPLFCMGNLTRVAVWPQ